MTLLMETSLPDNDYTHRRGELSTFGRALNAANKIRLVLALFALIVVVLLISLFMVPVSSFVVVLYVLIVGAGVAVLWMLIQQHLVEPDLATRKWLQQICDGELDSTISLHRSHPHYKELDFHTRNVGTSLRRLSDEMETLVDTQTQRLENQNQALELLFQLTSDVAHEIDQQSVLDKVCSSLSQWLGDASVGAYLKVDDGCRLQTAVGTHAFIEDCSVANLVNELTVQDGVVSIPVFRGREPMGVVEVVSDDAGLLERRDSQQVFKTVSEQLSMFVAKNYVLESVQQARVIEERARLGAEIHDSLAQTLLACRYQVRMLRETMQRDPTASVLKEVERVESTIDEANVEVRELIGQTRQTVDDQLFADNIQSTIDDLNRTGDIPVFFQNDNPHMLISARESTVVQRIVRESLINANKYSKASTIRVYLHVEHTGVRSLLIEDDGVGFCNDAPAQETEMRGEHIGLGIMRDRALSIGAILTIDSEPGEGTRIALKLPPLASTEELPS